MCVYVCLFGGSFSPRSPPWAWQKTKMAANWCAFNTFWTTMQLRGTEEYDISGSDTGRIIVQYSLKNIEYSITRFILKTVVERGLSCVHSGGSECDANLVFCHYLQSSLLISLSLCDCLLRIFPLAVWEVSPPRSSSLWWISCEVSDLPRWSHPVWSQHQRCRAGRESQWAKAIVLLWFLFLLAFCHWGKCSSNHHLREHDN